MANDRWKLRKEEGKVYGPVDTETIRKWIEEGRISPEDYLSREDKEEWVKAKSLPQFWGLFVPAAKATRPPPEVAQCPNCKNTLPQKASFCVKCGANLKEGEKRRKGRSNILRGAAIAGILSLIMFIPLTVLGVFAGMDRLEGNLITLYIFVLVISWVPYVIFIWGFKIMGEKISQQSIENSLLPHDRCVNNRQGIWDLDGCSSSCR